MSEHAAASHLVARIWRAFSHLIEECEPEQFHTGMQAMARENRKIVDGIKETYSRDLEHIRHLHSRANEEASGLTKMLKSAEMKLSAKELECKTCRDELSSLKTSHLELYEDKKVLDSKCDELEETVAKQTNVLKQYAKNILSLEESLKDTHERLADKSIDLENLDARASALEASLKVARKRIKELTEFLGEAREERNEARQSLSKTRLELGSVTEDFNDEKAERAKLEKKLIDAEVVLESTGAKLKFERAESDALKENMRVLGEQHQREIGARKTLEGALERKAAALQDAAAALQNAENTIAMQRKDASRGEEERAALSRRISELTREKNTQEQKLVDMAVKLEVASIDLARSHQSSEQQEQAVDDRNRQISELESEVKRCKKLIKDGEQKLVESESMLEKLALETHEAAMQTRAGNLEYEKRLKEAENRCNALDVERNEELSRRIAAEEKVNEFSAMFGNQKQKLGDTMVAYEETLSELESSSRRPSQLREDVREGL